MDIDYDPKTMTVALVDSEGRWIFRGSIHPTSMETGAIAVALMRMFVEITVPTNLEKMAEVILSRHEQETN